MTPRRVLDCFEFECDGLKYRAELQAPAAGGAPGLPPVWVLCRETHHVTAQTGRAGESHLSVRVALTRRIRRYGLFPPSDRRTVGR